MIKFNFAKIDSFTLLIPLEKVDVVSSTFLESYKKIYDTGEIEDDESFYNSYAKTENKDTKTFLKYKKVNRLFNGELREFLQVMLTSKLLLQDYFTGINESNIHRLYQYIIEDGIIYITESNFLSAPVTDIDICKDYQTDLTQFKDLKQVLLANVIPTKLKYVRATKVNSKASFGIQYNERSKATPSAPFVKLYFKTAELNKEKTKDFKETNLQAYSEIIEQGIGRIEVTIKNYKHKEKLGITNVKTLEDLLKLNQQTINDLHTQVLTEYYQNPVRMKTDQNDLSPTEYIQQGMLNIIYRQNPKITKEEILFECTKEVECKHKRAKIKKSLLETIQANQNRASILHNSEEKKVVLNIMKNLGIFRD